MTNPLPLFSSVKTPPILGNFQIKMAKKQNDSSRVSTNLTPSPQKDKPISSSSELALFYPQNEEPVPLIVFYPSSVRRRSSRFTTNKFSTSATEFMTKNRDTISPEKTVFLLPSPPTLAGKKTPAEVTRRSPRLVSLSARTTTAKEKGKKVNSRKSEGGVKQVELSRKRKPASCKMDEETRKSPRFNSDSSNGVQLALPEMSACGALSAGGRTGTKRELLALMMTTPANSSASRKRAARGSDSVNVGNNSRGSRRKDPVFAESPGTSVKITAESNSAGEKNLRSRKAQGSVNYNESKGSETKRIKSSAEKSVRKQKSNACFIGEPIDTEEAQQQWQWRYELKVGTLIS